MSDAASSSAPGRVLSPVVSILAILGTLMGVAGVFYKAQAHQDDRIIHLDPAAVVTGGGVAYKADVVELGKQIQSESRSIREAFRSLSLECRKRGENYTCRAEPAGEARR